MTRDTSDAAKLLRRYQHIRAVLQDAGGNWLELNSCADAIDAITHILSGGHDHLAPTFEDPARSVCDNCGKTWSAAQLRPAADLAERVDEDGPEPDGECPECGALCYEED